MRSFLSLLSCFLGVPAWVSRKAHRRLCSRIRLRLFGWGWGGGVCICQEDIIVSEKPELVGSW